MRHDFHVEIYPCEDTHGYWAECVSLPGCFTDGNTIQETQVNMFEAVNLFLQDDYSDVKDYCLHFTVKDSSAKELQYA